LSLDLKQDGDEKDRLEQKIGIVHHVPVVSTDLPVPEVFSATTFHQYSPSDTVENLHSQAQV